MSVGEAGSDGVLKHVLDRACEVVLVFHDPGCEAVAEQMAPPLVAAVERLGVGAVEPLEAVREAPELGLDDQVVVVRHQAEGEHAPVVTLDLAREEAEETAVVVGVAEGCGARYASGRDVVRALGRELSARSPHVATLAPRLAAATSDADDSQRICHAFVTIAVASLGQPPGTVPGGWDAGQPARRSTRR